MAQTSGEITQHIAAERNALGDNLQQLEERVKHAIDWRSQFQEHPMAMLAVAAGGGLLLARLLTGDRRRSHSDKSRDSRQVRDLGHAARIRDADDPMHQVIQTWNNVKGAIVGVAASKVQALLENLIPGFEEQYKQTAQKYSAASPRVSEREIH